ncbi:MAG: hypothetical protein DHS20C18_27020 [Saprospiraceae bacterium]|nr:MAG: hypothetical protein DHS20C18_27020 [Saprospiraceae bacterium]
MPGIWNYLKSLFKEVEHSSPSQPALHELIIRSDEEQQDYEQWKEGLIRRRLLDWLSDQYAIYRVSPNDIDEALDFLDNPTSKGFVIHFYKTNYTPREVTHLFDYLKEQVLQHNYRTQISDSRIYNRPDWVETTERHYLKPRINTKTDDKLHQAYGNVMIELELHDDKVHNLRFRATSYQDRQFHEAQEFRELMGVVLG